MNRSMIRATGLFSLLLALAACDGLLDVEDNPDLEWDNAQQPEFAESLVNGSLSRLSSGWDAMASLVAIASDEATFDGPFASWATLDEGNVDTPSNQAYETQYPEIASAFWYTAQVATTLDSLAAEGVLADSTTLARAYLYASLMHATVADVMATFAPSDLREPGPEIPAAQMDSLYDVAVEYATMGLAVDAGDYERDLLAARARAGFSAAIRRRIAAPADTTGGGLESDAQAAADAGAALALDAGPWRLTFDYSIFGARSNTIGQFNCGGADGNFIPGLRFADDVSITLTDPIDGVPDPTVERTIDEIYSPVGVCDGGTLGFMGADELRLIIAEDALANADTVTFAAQVNQIRGDEGLSDWTAASGVTARDMLVYERMARLFMRGRRLADLYRFGLQSDEWVPGSDAVVSPGLLYPIPQSEIDLNCYLNGTCG